LPVGESVTTPLAPREPQVPLQDQPEGMGSASVVAEVPKATMVIVAKEDARNLPRIINMNSSFLCRNFPLFNPDRLRIWRIVLPIRSMDELADA
jgi:hypothetical protein